MQKKLHMGYLVFVGVCLMGMVTIGQVLLAGAVFLPEIGKFFVEKTGEDFATVMPAVTIQIVIYSYVALVVLFFAGKVMNKVKGRGFFTIIVIALALSQLGQAFWQELWGFYLSSFIWGIAGPILWLLAPSILINNWFAPHKAGKYLGISSAFSGLGALVFSPIYAIVINNFGFRVGYVIEAIVILVCLLPFTLTVLHMRPESVGLKPVGSDDVVEQKEDGVGASGGMRLKVALGTAAFWLILIGGGLITLYGGIKGTLPTMIQDTFGATPDWIMVGSYVVSAGALGNIVGKIVQGFLADKIGVLIAVVSFAGLIAIGFLCLIFSGGIAFLLILGGFLVGTSDAMVSVGLPLITRSAFGLKHYSEIFSILNISVAAVGAWGATIATLIAAATGGYTMVFVVGIAAAVGIAACLAGAAALAPKLKAKWEAA
jgi:MFS family permease